MKLPTLLLSLSLLSPALRAELTVQGQPEETRAFLSKNQTQVTLRGRASITVEASEIKGQVVVANDAPTQGVALTAHEDQKKNFINRLQAIGIARGQITVPKFATITPRYGATAEQPIGYRAESTLTVQLSDQKQYLDLVALLDKSREARLGGLTYDHVQLANLQKQILTNACKHVMTRKEVYKQSLGVTLHPISFIEDEAPDSSNSLKLDQGSFGQITVQAAVQVVFEVDPVPAPAPKPSPAPAAP
jgi:uncharacterized protein YggE